MALSFAGHLPPFGLTLEATIQRRTTTMGMPPGAIAAFYPEGLVERRDRPADTGMEQLAQLLRAEDAEQACARIMAATVETPALPVANEVAVASAGADRRIRQSVTIRSPAESPHGHGRSRRAHCPDRTDT